MLKINDFAEEVHKNAVAHGWWEDERPLPEILMLCVSELSEALEEYRKGMPDIYCGKEMGKSSYPCGSTYKLSKAQWECEKCRIRDDEKTVCTVCKPEGIAIELADCVLRILDYCAYADIDLENALDIKHQYNKSRDYRHGGKKC